MSPADDTTEIDVSDSKTSKLEVALKLAVLTVGGSWCVWAASIVASFFGIPNSLDIANQLLPINTGTTGALLGYILGKQD